MPSSKTRFEQVPIEMVKKIIEKKAPETLSQAKPRKKVKATIRSKRILDDS
jgi:hypothetical protein